MAASAHDLFKTAGGLIVCATLAACGGGGDDSSSAAPTPVPAAALNGIAATGAALPNAAVTAKCTAGPEVSGTTGSDGAFTLSLSGGQVAPCMLKVTGGTPAVTLYGYAEAAGRVNITPATDLVLAKTLGAGLDAAFTAFDAAQASSVAAGLAAAKTYVAGELKAVTGSDFSVDPMTGVFVVGDANDKLLDSLGAAASAASKTQADLRGAAAQGTSMTALFAGTGGSSGVIGTGLYSGVTAQMSADFLALLPKACAAVDASPTGDKHYSKCLQDSSSPAVNLSAKVWLGGLPFQTGGSVVSGPAGAVAKVGAVSGFTDVAAGDACTVAIAEPYIPIILAQVKGVAYAPAATKPFSFSGTDNDSISINKDGVVFEYTMTNGAGYKIEVHPNLALFDPNASGTEGVLGSITGGNFTGFFICRN